MKLKQRFGGLVACLFAALVLSVLLNILSFSARSPDPNDIVADGGGAEGRILNRELMNSLDSESSKVRYRDLSKPESLVRIMDELRRVPTKENASYEDIASYLLQDPAYDRQDDTIKDFVKLGKVLEKQMKRKNDDDSGLDFLAPVVKKVAPQRQPTFQVVEDFPVFKLNPTTFHSLLKYVDSKRQHHKMKSQKKPITFRIHKDNGNLKSWQLWQNSIDQFSLYKEADLLHSGFLRDLSAVPVVGLSTMADYGTQIKLILKLADESQVLFKPMRVQRNQERDPNLFYFDDFERHHAEIAAFHLDRIMQFHRVPPNVGRFVNITSDIEQYASRSFRKTIYYSPSGNRCFYGKCDYYCDSGHPVCAPPETPYIIEGAAAAWLPFGKGTTKKGWENPWRRSYSKQRKADWEVDDKYCDDVKKTPPYDEGRRLLDLMDITIFDYIAGNQDRHHYHTFTIFGNYTSPMLYDNGRGFGFIHTDDPSILVPVVQCCQIRYTTLRRLLAFESGGDNLLSARMRKSLLQDPLSSGIHGPVLAEGHMRALDRRVSKVLDAVWDCVSVHGYESVILDDGF